MTVKIERKVYMSITHSDGTSYGYVSEITDQDTWVDLVTSDDDYNDSEDDERKDFSNFTSEELVTFIALAERWLRDEEEAPDIGKHSVKFEEVIKTTEIKDLDLDEEMLKERRQYELIRNMRDCDLKILGLDKLAVYGKLKFHNV